MGIVFSAMISMLSVQHKELKSIKQQLLSMNLKHFILQTMTKLSNCTCHFHQTVSPSAPGPFNIDTTITEDQTSHDINLGSFRSSCDFSSDNNIIVADNKEVKGSSGMTVESVKVTEIRRSGGNAYQGILTVGFKGSGLVRAIRPIEVDVILTVDSSAGADETERPIKTCGSEPATPSNGSISYVTRHGSRVAGAQGDKRIGDSAGTYAQCPEGMRAVGVTGETGTYAYHFTFPHNRVSQGIIDCFTSFISRERVRCYCTIQQADAGRDPRSVIKLWVGSKTCTAICAPISPPL